MIFKALLVMIVIRPDVLIGRLALAMIANVAGLRWRVPAVILAGMAVLGVIAVRRFRRGERYNGKKAQEDGGQNGLDYEGFAHGLESTAARRRFTAARRRS
ncbi:MAG: hypothetical protein U1E30_07810 [Rhodoblastus sp.]